MEPYESLNWMWQDMESRDASLKDTISGKHAKMFFALGACAYHTVQRQQMTQIDPNDGEGAVLILRKMIAEASAMLHDAKNEFTEHKDAFKQMDDAPPSEG